MQAAAGDRAPRRPDRDARLVAAQPRARDQGDDDRRAPHDRRGVAEKKPVMAVENADAERRQDQKRDAGKENADEHDRERARRAGKAGRDQIEQPRRREPAEQGENAGDERQEAGDRARHTPRLVILATRSQGRVNRDERGREHALAEQVLQEVRDADGGGVRIRGRRRSEVVPQHALPHEPREA